MSTIAQDALDALAAGAKGAAAGSIVPGLGTVVGGLVGLASSIVPHIFGADAQPALAAVAQAITGSADEATQVQVLSTDPAAIAQFKVQALQIAADQQQAQLDAQTNDIAARLGDVADARQQTIDLAKAGSTISWSAPVVSVLVVVAFGGAIATILMRAVPEGSQQLAYVLLGTLAAAFGQVVNYWLGSSAGSAAKDSRLDRLLPHPSQPSVVVPENKVKAA